MKTLLLLLPALTLSLGIFAQGNTNINPQVQMQNINYYNQIDINNDLNSIQTTTGNQQANPPVQSQFASADPQSGSVSGPDENNKSKTTGCKDCDEVKQALKASYASSSGAHHNRSYSMKQWTKRAEGKINLKMKKVFASRYKARTSYAICFNWH